MRMRQMVWGALLIGGVIALWVIVAWPSGGGSVPREIAGAPAAPIEMPVTIAPPSAIVAAASQPKPAALPPAPQAQLAAPAQPAKPDEVADIMKEPYGPLDHLVQLYASESRASAAADGESLLTAAFADANLTPPLLKSVLCHERVCKLELNWAPDRMSAYIVGMTKASLHFDPNPGVDPRGPQNDRVRTIEAYLIRKPGASTRAD
jgi:hypothetical protein